VVEPVLEQRAIRQAGEVVVERRVAQAGLERDALGDVAEVEQDAVDVGVVEVVVGDHLERAVVAVRGADAHAEHADATLVGDRVGEEARGAVALVGVHEPAERRPEQVARSVAEHLLHRVGQPAHRAGRVDDRDDVH
jgi:hypothetical protein